MFRDIGTLTASQRKRVDMVTKAIDIGEVMRNIAEMTPHTMRDWRQSGPSGSISVHSAPLAAATFALRAFHHLLFGHSEKFPSFETHSNWGREREGAVLIRGLFHLLGSRGKYMPTTVSRGQDTSFATRVCCFCDIIDTCATDYRFSSTYPCCIQHLLL